MSDLADDLARVAADHLPHLRSELLAAEAATAAARTELRRRKAEAAALTYLLSIAEPATPGSDTTALTLHEAMRTVLLTAPSHRMRAPELANEIERRNLYRMRDGRRAEAGQLHARVGHYGNLFEKDGSYIKLRDD